MLKLMIDKIMTANNINNYRYDVKDKTLFIYEKISVARFVRLKDFLCNELKIKNIVVKGR